MSSGSSDDDKTKWNWTTISGIAGVVSVVVAILAVVLDHSESAGGATQPQGIPPAAASVSAANSPPSLQATSTPLPTSPGAGSGHDGSGSGSQIGLGQEDNHSRGSFESVSNTITKFNAVSRNDDRLVGENRFVAYDKSIQLSFWWDIKNADGADIQQCTITSVLTSPDDTNVNLSLTPANCPSRSSYVSSKKYLEVGNYRLVSTAYVPATKQRVEDVYDFSVVSTG